MIIKAIVCLSILIFTTTIGYLLASKYRNRKIFFMQFHLLNERFLREIEYQKRPIREFIQKNIFKGDFCQVLNIYLDNLGNFDDFLSIFPEISYLNNEEIKFLSEYLNSLGKGDSGAQKKHFSALNTQIDEFKKSSEVEYKRYADLYVKLGVLIGLAIIIVII